MNLSDNFKKFMGMVGENAQQLKKDLTPTPLPSGPEVWEAGRKNGEKMKEEIGKKGAEMAVDLLPAGAAVGMMKKVAEDFFGMHKSTALGDIVLTRSAKDPSKFQMTFFEGKLGQSNTVRDEQFDTMEDAVKAFRETQ